MNKAIIPKIDPQIARAAYNEIEWKNFALRITKNPFVKEFLLQKDGNSCQWCNKPMNDNIIIHHISYEHSCTFGKVIEINRATEKRPNKVAVVPDCKLCKEGNEDRFNTCISKLALVHSGCNWIISKHST